MSQRNRFRDAAFWLRCGCVMGLVHGIVLIPASAAGAVTLLAVSGWVMWGLASGAAVSLGIALLALGVWLIAGVVETEDRIAGARWAIAAGSVVLWSSRGLRASGAALAGPPGADVLRERAFEDLIEDIRHSTMTGDPNRVQFGSVGLGSGSFWCGRLRDADAVLESTTSSGDGGSEDRYAVIVERGDIEIERRGTTMFGKRVKAGFRIGDRRFTGTISEEALGRFNRWKGKTVTPTP